MPVMMMMMMQVTRSAMPTLFLGSGLALAEDIAKASEQDWNSAMASRGRKPPRREQQQQQLQQQPAQAQAPPQLQQQPAEAQADDDANVTTPIKGGTATTPTGNGNGNANPAGASTWDATATAAPSPKPFFIMDWLDDLTADHDLTQIARLLQTPAKKKKTMRWKLRQDDGRDDYGVDDDYGGDDDDDVCSVASPTSPMLFDQDADPTTPKSSNRRNKHSLLSTSVSCPSFRTRPPPPQPSSTHITSPLRPKQLLFGRWSSPATRHGGHGHDHNNHESNQAAGATTTTNSTYPSGPESALPLPLQRRSISASHADLDSGTRGTSSDLLTPPRSTDRAMLRPRRRRRRSPRSPQTMYRKSVRLGNAWNTKGLQKAQLGAWQDALACWDNALEIRQHLLGGRHVDVAHTCNNRGIALGQLGCFGEAFEALEQALNIHQYHLEQLAQLQLQQQQQPNDDEGQDEDNECTGKSTEGDGSKIPMLSPSGHAHSTTSDVNAAAAGGGGGASTTATRITGIGSRIKSHQGAMISTLHNMANVHQQAEQLDQALRVLVLARDLAQDHFQQDREQERQQRLLLRPQGSPDFVDHETLPPVMSSSSSSLIPIARLCVAIGHIYVQVEQWTDARDAYQDAIVWYRHEREQQRYLLSLCQQQQQQQTQQRQDTDRDDLMSDMAMTTDDNETYQEDALSAALLSCQQELLDVERDLSHILAHHNDVELHPQDRQQQQQQLMTKKGENRQDVVCGFPTSRHR